MLQIPGFDVQAQLAEKRKAVILRAVRTDDQTPVILKTSQEQYPSPRDLARFKMAYEISGRFDHPGLIRCLDLLPYRNALVLVMEDFGGEALSTALKQGPLPISTFLDYAIKISAALEHMHDRGVIHKDIKPANIIHNPETGQVCIVDFSIASQLSQEKQKVVSLHVLEGSLQYISPEQTGRMNRPVDYRSDFYSLGVTCYEMLTGRLPFESLDAVELVHCHLAKSPVPVHGLRPEVPRALSDIVARLMSKTAEQRYQSAQGLTADLRHCQEEWRRHGAIATFDLGRSDQLSRFQLPNKLYGREREIEQLLEIFNRVSEGGLEMILVAGYSGVGKSALLQEIHKPIVERRGYFISTKFDQYRRDIPFLAISEAFKGLVLQLLTEPEERVAQWREQLLKVLGGMGQVVIDVIPEVQLLIGEQPQVVALEGPEAQNRFVDVFERFLGVFTARDHPLVCFLDDLQWADVASLRLFERIMERKDSHHLLILGAYRDNEVNASHPLMLSLDKIGKHRALNKIQLAPLSLEHTGELIADTVHSDRETVAPLAELAHAKTHGNPFFLGQLLLSLYDQNLIRYDFDTRAWSWDLGKIRLAAVSDQVVDLMTRKIRGLDADVQELLKLASCLGNRFDLKTLATISGLAERRAVQLLFRAIQDGLILSLDDSFKYFLGDGDEPTGDSLSFKFLHDRVHEAAYVQMSVEQRKEVHLRIGRTLRGSLDAAALDERIFEVVNHLNLGVGHIDDAADRADLAALNLVAGKKARSSTAHAAARDYLARGLGLMEPDAWSSRYQPMFELHRNLIECEYLCGNLERAEKLFDVALDHARSHRDKADVYELMMNAYMTCGRFSEGVDFGRRALRTFGIELPEDPATFQQVLDAEFATIRELIGERGIDELAAIPANRDEDLRITMSLLHQTWNNSYFAEGLYDHGTIAALRILTLSLTAGYTNYTSFGYVTFGLNLSSVFGDYDAGYEYGRLAVRLLHKYDNIHLVAKINNLFAHFISHYKRDFSENIPHYEESYKACLQTGDLWYGLWAVNFIPHVRFIKGVALEEVYRDALKYHDYAENSGNEMMFQLLNMDEHMVLNLQGKTADPLSFDSESYSEKAMVAMLKAIPYDFGLFWYDLYKSFVYYLYGESELALEHSLAAEPNKGTAPGLMLFPEHHYLSSLILCDSYERRTAAERESDRRALEKNRERLEKWGRHGPDNYLHKHLLVEAEIARLDGRREEALRLYENAAEEALKSGAVHNAAIANELAGKLLLAAGHRRAASGYLMESAYLFERWGARRKVEQMQRRYGDDLLQAAAPRETLSLESTTASSGGLLDLQAVLKASQTLSSQIRLSELLRKMLSLLIEDAGAEKGALLIKKEGEWVIVASGDVHAPIEVFRKGRGYQGSPDLSHAVVQYVLRTREDLVVDDAAAHSVFSTDEYVRRHRVRSLLCTPIRSHNRQVAVLYLENNLTVGAFTDDRLNVLKILSAQAAISLENALLYADLEEYTQRLEQKVEERTRELKKKNEQLEAKNEEILRTQQQLIMQEKLASLGTLTAGVAHEIKNPLNFVRNFAKLSGELAGELAEQLPGEGTAWTGEQHLDVTETLDQLRQNIDKIGQHSQRIDSVVRGMLSLSRSASASPEPTDLNELVDEYVNLAYHGMRGSVGPLGDVSVKMDLDPNLGTVYVVPQDIGRVLLNLSSNALYAVLEDSRHGEAAADPAMVVTTRDHGDTVEIRVRDNGPGIPRDILDKVFNPFFTTKPAGKGTGLGLSICQQIVGDQHHGTITVESEPGEFTELVVRLPKDARHRPA